MYPYYTAVVLSRYIFTCLFVCLISDFNPNKPAVSSNTFMCSRLSSYDNAPPVLIESKVAPYPKVLASVVIVSDGVLINFIA